MSCLAFKCALCITFELNIHYLVSSWYQFIIWNLDMSIIEAFKTFSIKFSTKNNYLSICICLSELIVIITQEIKLLKLMGNHNVSILRLRDRERVVWSKRRSTAKRQVQNKLWWWWIHNNLSGYQGPMVVSIWTGVRSRTYNDANVASVLHDTVKRGCHIP
jgi:hypothetical protein